ncbi:MAG TPA: CPBP family intramembrane metalloprotease [Anaerolineales bacterium]|nr:CPBP family intramembrane metalloprotease [Anaerolineales bacterium]
MYPSSDNPSIDSPSQPSKTSLWRGVHVLIILPLAAFLCLALNVLAVLPGVWNLMQSPEFINNPDLLNDQTFLTSQLMTFPVILGSVIATIVSLGGSVWLVLLLGRVLNWRKELFRAVNVRWWLSVPVLVLVLLLLNAGTSALLMWVLGEFDNPQEQMFGSLGLSWAVVVLLPLFGGVFIGFAEEMFFRGFVYRVIRDRWGFWVGWIASSAIFALAHMMPILFLPLFVVGLFLAFLYERSRSLWIPITVHALNNIIAFAIIFWGMR